MIVASIARSPLKLTGGIVKAWKTFASMRIAMSREESPPNGMGVYILKCIKWLNVFGKLKHTRSVHDIPTCKANAERIEHG